MTAMHCCEAEDESHDVLATPYVPFVCLSQEYQEVCMWSIINRRLTILGIVWTMCVMSVAQAATLQLVSSAPTNNQVDVSRFDALQLQFSSPISSYSVRADTVTLRSDAGIQKAGLSVSGASVTIRPLTPLLPWTTYSLTAKSLVATSGESLAQPVTIAFMTHDAAWQAPLTIDRLVPYQFNPTTATNGNGVRFSAWQQSLGGGDAIWVVRHLGNETDAGPFLLASFPQNYVSELALTVDDSGNAFATWIVDTPSGPRPRHLWASRFKAGSGSGSGWSTPQIIDGYATRSATNAHLVVDHAGNAFVLWQEFDCCFIHSLESIVVARYTQQAGWSKPTRLDDSYAFLAGKIDIKVDAAGNAYATWFSLDYLYYPEPELKVSRYAINQGWSVPKVIAVESTMDSDGSPALAVDPRGEALLMWADDTGLKFARADQFGNWSAPILIDSAVRRSPSSMMLLDSGVAFAAFVDGVKTYLPDKGWWSWTHPLFNQQNASSDPRIVVDPSGNAVVVWTQTNNGIGRIYAKRYRANHGWLNAAPIDAGNSLGAGLEELFLDASGSASAAWWQSNDLGTSDVKVAVFK
jgi:hypothetical protein